MNEGGGYPSGIFVIKPHDRLLCLLCNDVLHNPHQCFNGHVFCHGCIEAYISLNCKCPLCNISLSAADLAFNKVIADVVQELQVKCNTKVCLWTGPLSARSNHIEKECMFTSLKCTADGCCEKIPRFCLQDHLISCRYRPISCDHCEQPYPFKELANHRIKCIERPVACSNQCGCIIHYVELAAHLSNECPLQEVQCNLYAQGRCFPSCTGLYQRKDKQQHDRTLVRACSEVSIICSRVIASECEGDADDRVRWIMDTDMKAEQAVQGDEYSAVRL